jgi:chromosome segregation ATPase
MIEAALATYSFPTEETQSPALIAVPASILDEILSEVQALRDEVQDLKATVARQEGELSTLRQRITALEATQETQAENQLIQLRLIKDLRENIQNESEPTPTEKTTAHVEGLYKLMRRDRLPPLPLSRASKLIGVSKARMKQLKAVIAKDERFEIIRDPHHKQRLLIRLRIFGGR